MDTTQPVISDSSHAYVRGGPREAMMSIAAVERETGIGKDTLRAWERRYGFPLPQRDASGVRVYSRALVDRLRLIRRALLAGQRPGRLLALPLVELDAVLAGVSRSSADIAGASSGPAVRSAHAWPAGALAGSPLTAVECLSILRRDGPEALLNWLTRGLARMGLAAFVIDAVAPMTAEMGAGWLAGRIAVHEEHLYTEAVQSVLRNSLLPFRSGLETAAPRVLLTTVPGEEHGLGLLMVEALMTLDACRCISLGVQTPIDDIVAACLAHRIDVVALSFSQSLPAHVAASALADLRGRLPAQMAIWAGGGSPVLRAQGFSGIQVMHSLVDLMEATANWRNTMGAVSD